MRAFVCACFRVCVPLTVPVCLSFMPVSFPSRLLHSSIPSCHSFPNPLHSHFVPLPIQPCIPHFLPPPPIPIPPVPSFVPGSAGLNRERCRTAFDRRESPLPFPSFSLCRQQWQGVGCSIDRRKPACHFRRCFALRHPHSRA